ncbi:transposase [Bacillus wiedmannii]
MLHTITRLGDTTIINLLPDIGSFSHYQHPHQLLEIMRLTLRENSSGEYK